MFNFSMNEKNKPETMNIRKNESLLHTPNLPFGTRLPPPKQFPIVAASDQSPRESSFGRPRAPNLASAVRDRPFHCPKLLQSRADRRCTTNRFKGRRSLSASVQEFDRRLFACRLSD